MARFILIDHSITDLGGHHYEYALRVLRSAGAAGYTIVLATNRQFKNDDSMPWAVYPAYRHGFWYRLAEPAVSRIFRSLVAVVRNWLFLLKFSLLLSPLGLLWASRFQPGEFELLKRAQPARRITLVPIAIGLYAVNATTAALELLKAAIPFQHYLKGLFTGLARFVQKVFSPLLFIIRPSDEALRWLAKQYKAQTFGEDTQRLFRQIGLRAGDIVFIPTLAEPELLGLLSYFHRDVRSRQATWHLLFRRNIYTGRDPDYGLQDETLRPLRNEYRYFWENLAGQRVHFYTDTDQLTEQYNRLGIATFHTLPIPVDSDYHVLTPDIGRRGPLRITYVGDARSEKGYHFLPRLVQDLWLDYVETGRIEFALQSNYNTPRGEPAVVVARAQLEYLTDGVVHLEKQPLTADEYRKLVLSGDITLVLYDQENYYARSSGIFAEALVAGIPVVVPAGTWMAMQLARATYEYHQDLQYTRTLLKTRRGSEVRWRIHGAPDSNPLQEGQVVLAGSVPRYCWLAVPKRATHVLVTFRQASDLAGQFVHLLIDQLDQADNSLGQHTTIVGGENDTPGSMLVTLEQGTRKLWLGMRNAFAANRLNVCDLRLDFLSVPEGLPLSIVGTVYADPDHIARCVREVIAHYSHYRASAHDFSNRWASYHNSSCLLAHLIHLQQPHENKNSLPSKSKSWHLSTREKSAAVNNE